MTRAIAEVSSLKDLSPEQATAKLAEMTAAYRGEAKPAAGQLSGLLKDAAFLRGIQHGGAAGASDGIALPGGETFEKLQKAVGDYRLEAGDPVSRAIAGQLDDINDSKALQMKQAADVLRGLDIKDDVIRQVLAGEPVSRTEHDRVKQWKDDVMTGHQHEAFRKAYLAGDPGAVRQMNHANIVLTSPIKEEAA